jgi:hypothetical protein
VCSPLNLPDLQALRLLVEGWISIGFSFKTLFQGFNLHGVVDLGFQRLAFEMLQTVDYRCKTVARCVDSEKPPQSAQQVLSTEQSKNGSGLDFDS